ncbi:hypothetical protein Q8A73_006720 [Channa argus]|nr:hypothetical protein Q8A73_006720 [Channa argus]
MSEFDPKLTDLLSELDLLGSVVQQSGRQHFARKSHIEEDVLGGALGRYVQRKLSAIKIFEEPFVSVKENLRTGAAICEQWVVACEHLTGQSSRFPSRLVVMESLERRLGHLFARTSLMCLQANNRVMDLDHVDGRLKIQYSDRLISLLREVRQFSALGFPIPAKIQQASNTGDKFYRQAIVLKQVAHFYNTIDQQMIPSQRPMMLSHALAFEQVIKNPHSQSKESGGKVQITWDNPKELEVYIAKLQSVAEKLSTENRKLRKWHTDFTDKVVTLMNVDLLKHKQQWKDGLQDLRTGFATLEAQGFRSDDMRAWRQHWNHQLYKALEHQYQTGLEALNKNLPEIHVDLTFNVLEVVAYEARRLFRHRLVSSKDLHSFDNILSSIIRGDWGSDALDNMTVPSGDINNISAYTTSAVSSGPTLPVSPGPSLAISSASSKALPLTPYSINPEITGESKSTDSILEMLEGSLCSVVRNKPLPPQRKILSGLFGLDSRGMTGGQRNGEEWEGIEMGDGEGEWRCGGKKEDKEKGKERNDGGKEKDREDIGGQEGNKREEEGRDLWVTFLKYNHLGAALLPGVSTGQRSGLTACDIDS